MARTKQAARPSVEAVPRKEIVMMGETGAAVPLLPQDQVFQGLQALDKLPYHSSDRQELHEFLVENGQLGDFAVRIRGGRVNNSNITTAIYDEGTGTLRLDSLDEPGFHCELDMEEFIEDNVPDDMADLYRQLQEEKTKRKRAEEKCNDLILNIAILAQDKRTKAAPVADEVVAEAQAPSC